MESYDPLVAPPPQEWLELDEDERRALIEDYHLRARIPLPNTLVHATFHLVIENQLTMGDEIPVAKTLARLMTEGLDLHDAIHAIGSVLAGHLNRIAKGAQPGSDPSQAYYAGLKKLTAKKWLRM